MVDTNRYGADDTVVGITFPAARPLLSCHCCRCCVTECMTVVKLVDRARVMAVNIRGWCSLPCRAVVFAM